MNGGKANTNKLFSSGASARRSGAGGRNTLEDFLSGHRKNSYGVEGMCVTNNPNADKNILNSKATLIEEGKNVACILKGGNVIAVLGYKE